MAFPTGEIVNLSHAYDSQTIYWPTAEGFQLRRDADGVTAAGYYYAANSFFTSEHGGTHIDAPEHFAEGHQTVHQIPLDRLMGPAVVIDVTQQSARDADYQVSGADFQRFEQDHGAIPKDSIVLLRTGFSTRWPGTERYLGTTLRGDEGARNLHFRDCIRMRRVGSSPTGRFAPLASIPPASITDLRAFSNLIASSTSTIYPRSRT